MAVNGIDINVQIHPISHSYHNAYLRESKFPSLPPITDFIYVVDEGYKKPAKMDC